MDLRSRSGLAGNDIFFQRNREFENADRSRSRRRLSRQRWGLLRGKESRAEKHAEHEQYNWG